MAAMRITEEELQAALEAANRMRLKGIDPHYLAHCLLALHERNGELEELLVKADLYLRFGQGEKELTDLRAVVARLREEVDEGSEDTTML